MDCLIKGCNFLLKNIPDEVFQCQRHSNPEFKFQTIDQDDIFPYLLVNIGSGVSMIKVWFKSPKTRVSGAKPSHQCLNVFSLN